MTRVGIGFDSHRLAPDRRLVLGGVEIAHELGLQGHSDADVLTHAIIDALLGAAGLGDIGELFPDTDERHRDADSLELLATVLAHVREAGLRVVNVDCTLIAEQPKLAPHKAAIRERLAAVLTLPVERVNVKATTAEGMGFVGRGEGLAALAVAGLDPLDAGNPSGGSVGASMSGASLSGDAPADDPAGVSPPGASLPGASLSGDPSRGASPADRPANP